MFYVGMIKVLQTAKFPLEICKGSCEERLALAKKLNNKFFNKISEKFTTKEISFDVFEKTLQENTPAKIGVSVKDYGNKRGGNTSFKLNDEENGIEGLLIFLEKGIYNKGIRLLDTDISLHETYHYFSHLANPKHTARTAKMHEKGLLEKTEKFYSENFYTRKKFNAEELKENLNNFLQQFTPQEQIEFLQNSRYRMTEEYNAFDEGYKYLEKIQDEHPDLICEKIYGREKEEYNFLEKFKIAADKLKEIISSIRKS